MKIIIFYILYLLITLTKVNAATTYTEGIIDFSLINPANTRNIIGNTEIVGNTVECVTSSFYETDGNYSDLSCSNDLNKNDNNYIIKYIDIDSDNTTFNSSTATVHFPTTYKEIAWVGLFWQGHINNTSYQYSIQNNYSGWDWDYYYATSWYYGYNNLSSFARSTDLIDNDIQKTNANKVLLKINNNNYVSVEADHLNYIYNNRFSANVQYGATYAAVADVTSLFGSYTSNEDINITIANIACTQGLEASLGNFGAWTLVVIYKEDLENIASKLRNNSTYYGYKEIYNNNPDSITLSDFMLPKSGNIESSMAVFAGEGEYVYTPDTMQLDGVSLGDPDPNNVFDARLSSSIIRNPSLNNNNGIDIDVFDTSAIMTSKRDDDPDALTYTSVIELTSGGDLYLPSMVSFTTDLYVPKFCYDYAYKQQDVYFTEQNDGSHNPRLSGNVLKDEAIQVTLYLKNLVDPDISITDMYIDITDINTTQANYVHNSTKLARVGELYPVNLVDGVDVTVGTDPNGFEYIKDIDIGTIDTDEYFYTYYSINPNVTSLDMPIKAKARYTITLAGVPIYYDLSLGANIPICSTSNFKYAPAKGIFNIVHNDYYDYDIDGSKRYYNLPTQVTKREGNFKVISMDPDNLDNLKGVSTIVAVEMIDASAFHDTNASCGEMASSISPRVWVSFENNATSTMFDQNALATAIANGKTTLLNSSDFYKQAKQNAAFRVSYNLANNNGALLDTEEVSPGRVKLTNFPSYAGDKCNPSFGNGHETVPANCGNNGNGVGKNGMTPAELTTCMECIYGLNTKLVCSRDNFSIRPEALLIKLDDQNQSNPTVQTRIDDTISGVTTPNPKVLHLSAGYQYNIEVNATNHLNNEASAGYTKTFNLDNSSLASYIFEPRSITVANANLYCNAPFDINLSNNPSNTIRILNGLIDSNTSIAEVGEYRLSIRDTSWTTVDSDLATMSHHIAPYFTSNTDCYSNSDITQNVNAVMNPNDITTLNGCNISSSHTNNEANLRYNDYNVTFHPYKFDLNGTAGGNPIIPTVGLNFSLVTTDPTAQFVYMSDINDTLDENMSYHLNGSIVALGEDNSTLSNFVDNCYATPLDINITTTNRDLNDSNDDHVDYRIRFHDINSSGSVINALDINITETNTTVQTNDILLQTVQTSTKGYFPKNLNGTMQTRLNINYVRKKDTTVNPATITFIKYQVNCTNATVDCTFNADLVNNKTTKGVKDLNATIAIRHYYGRTHAPRTTIQGSDGNVSMYYEVFCNGATCNKALLQDGSNSATTDDPRWFVNTKHTNNFGTAAQTPTKQKNVSNIAITREADGNHPDYIGVQYNGSRGYPYKTTMENNASGWLIYNKYNPNATTNEFEVEFISPSGDWAGVHETNATTSKNASDNTNRRLMW